MPGLTCAIAGVIGATIHVLGAPIMLSAAGMSIQIIQQRMFLKNQF